MRRGEVEVIDVPTALIKPRRFDIVLDIRGVTWRRIQFEVSADEAGIGDEQVVIESPSLDVFGLAEESGLGVQTLNNTKGDFSNSPRLQRAVEDAVWRHDVSGNKLRKAAADLSPRELVQMVLEFGLYEMLREQAG